MTNGNDQQAACWHIEPGTPCDWDVCHQPERLAAGDRGADPGTVTFIPELRRVSVCESGRHEHHIGQTCAEVDAEPSIETLLGEALKGMWPDWRHPTP